MEKNNYSLRADGRALKAFLLAPLPVLILMWLAIAFVYMLEGANPMGILLGLYVFIVGLFFAYVIELLLAVPVFYALKKRGIENMWVTILLAGLFAGGMWFVFGHILLSRTIAENNVRTPYTLWSLMKGSLIMMFLGAIAGLTFWKVYRAGNAK